MATDGSRTERVEVRTAANVLDTTEDALGNLRIFRLDETRWRAFQSVFDRPAVAKPRLARLLADRSALE